jgi:fumarate hydratase subunit beta
VLVSQEGEPVKKNAGAKARARAKAKTNNAGAKEIWLKTPIGIKQIQKLKAGDKVLLSGTIFAARDKAHQFLLETHMHELDGAVVYHCGPIIKDNKVIAAGPTTSSRMNVYTPGMISEYGIRAIIGKGGMDENVISAMKGRCVYLAAVGGAAVVYAKALWVTGVHKKEFGMPEAIWVFEAMGFPAIVAIDSKGKSIYDEVLEKSGRVFSGMIR